MSSAASLDAAIFEALAMIPGVTLVQHAVTAVGQAGVAVERTVSGVPSELMARRS
jgi:hypothetical protein